MNHMIVAPVVLPALIAALTLLGMRRTLLIGRVFSITAVAALVAIAAALLIEASDGEVRAYALGDWRAPFGIVLVLDRLSAMMLMLVALLALAVLCYSVATGLDRRGWHFHPLFHFQLLGLNGAFLTGDLFNLFVFFEVLLIASYGLMLHGQGAARLKAGVQYVIINLVGSTFFLIGIGILYGLTGTLNMADMALRVAALPEGDQGLLRSGALILIAVFALKAALLPLHLWLPRTYASTSPAVAAFFAIMTKVGVYSIVRMVTLVFGENAGAAAWAPAPWMLPAALLTIVVGFTGLLASRGLRDLAAFAVVGSTGTLLAAVSLFEPAAMAAGLYYLPHTTLAGACLFLVSDLIARRRPDYGDSIALGPRFSGIERLSVLFFLTAIAVAGLPPLSGFIGKLLILHASMAHPAMPWIWATILATTLIAIVGLARAGSIIFWKSAQSEDPPRPAPAALRPAAVWPPVGILAMLAALTLFAGPVTAYMEAASDQLFAPASYIEAVLGPGEGG
jgi:multicomponent K+:H+ antiporter subunit D